MRAFMSDAKARTALLIDANLRYSYEPVVWPDHAAEREARAILAVTEGVQPLYFTPCAPMGHGHNSASLAFVRNTGMGAALAESLAAFIEQEIS